MIWPKGEEQRRFAVDGGIRVCGICGLINIGDEDTLFRMVDAIRHRGPDDSGIFCSTLLDGRFVGLGNARLSIIDLSPAGHMPMANEDETVWMTYNGEIYNHIELRKELVSKGHLFKSNTDTEAIIHLYEEYGTACFAKLNGIFSIAIWDKNKEALILARDSFGVKPLYYHASGNRISFSSEIRSLLLIPGFKGKANYKALNTFLTLLWMPGEETLFEGVKKLLPGHYAVLRDGAFISKQYVDVEFPNNGSRDYQKGKALYEKCTYHVEEAVKRQMISDVPTGAFLSAGLDSSTIVRFMAKNTNDHIETYTIGFPGKYYKGQKTLDDVNVAHKTARRFDCSHHEIIVEPSVMDLLPKLIWYMEEPVADPAIIMAYCVCKEASKSSTVLLSGLGGDELFGGYRKYVAYYLARTYQKMPRSIRSGMLEPLINSMPAMMGTSQMDWVRLIKKMARSGSLPFESRFLMDSTYLAKDEVDEIFSEEMRKLTEHNDPFSFHKSCFERISSADPLHQMQYVDMKTFMVDLNLLYTDKMSMANSVEVRVPFLDRELVDFVVKEVPPSEKVRMECLKYSTKSILRKIMKEELPPEVNKHPKAGFGAPINYWLKDDLRPVIEELLSKKAIIERGIFNYEVVKKMKDEYFKGRRDWSMQIWTLLVLELWQRVFFERSNAWEIPSM